MWNCKRSLQSPGLPASHEFRGHKVLWVLVVGNNVHQIARAFKVVTPNLEGLMDGKELIIVSIMVEFQSRKYLRVESNWPDFFRMKEYQ